jgi:proline dehydrogenase
MSYRSFMIALADSSFARSIFLRDGKKPGLVRRYVAGDQLSDALEAASEVAGDGTMATLDYLGENLTLTGDIGEAIQHYKELIKAVSTFYPTAHVSIKLSALGLLVSEDLARENLRRILEFSRERGGMFIRVDMEGSDYTDITLELVREMYPEFPFMGTVIQSYLRRSDKDIEELNEAGIPIRLVKGAYAESPAVAYSLKQDVNRQFRKQMYALLEDGVDPAIATHDPQIISDARIFIRRNSIKTDHYTFEMLMGVRRDLQSRLRAEGHAVRVYIPYGARWYPYFTRRLAEHPANLGFFVKNLAKG